MKKARFYLVKLPIISITIFFFCSIIAALIYPGSHKEIIEYQSDYYSFTHNFLSELGSLKTNTDETNLAIIQKDNTPSMLLFNGSLILIGGTLMLFYFNFKKVFGLIGDSSKSIFYSKITMPVGLLAGFFYAGVGFVPHDLDFGGACVFCKLCLSNSFLPMYSS